MYPLTKYERWAVMVMAFFVAFSCTPDTGMFLVDWLGCLVVYLMTYTTGMVLFLVVKNGGGWPGA